MVCKYFVKNALVLSRTDHFPIPDAKSYLLIAGCEMDCTGDRFIVRMETIKEYQLFDISAVYQLVHSEKFCYAPGLGDTAFWLMWGIAVEYFRDVPEAAVFGKVMQ